MSKTNVADELVQSPSTFYYSAAFDAASVADAETKGADVTVAGVALGDIVLGVSLAVDVVDLTLDAQVTAANTVTVTLNNNTNGTVDLASATLRLLVLNVSAIHV